MVVWTPSRRAPIPLRMDLHDEHAEEHLAYSREISPPDSVTLRERDRILPTLPSPRAGQRPPIPRSGQLGALVEPKSIGVRQTTMGGFRQ